MQKKNINSSYNSKQNELTEWMNRTLRESQSMILFDIELPKY